MRTLWSSRAHAKVSCQNAAPANCFGIWGYWGGMCINCRRDPTAYARDPCVAKFERGAGRSQCYGPNDTRGVQFYQQSEMLRERHETQGGKLSAALGAHAMVL